MIFSANSMSNALLRSKDYMEIEEGYESLGSEKKSSQSKTGLVSDLDREVETGLEIKSLQWSGNFGEALAKPRDGDVTTKSLRPKTEGD